MATDQLAAVQLAREAGAVNEYVAGQIENLGT